MSDAIDRAFEQALIRSMGGEDPIESAKLVHVSTLAFTQQEAVKSSIFTEDSRWEQRQSDMDTKGIKPTDQRWMDAAEVHNLLVASYKQQLKLLQKVGNPRGL
jgi:hypothetical protein